jgi:hypothetical protein
MRALLLSSLMLAPLLGCGDRAASGVCTMLFAMIPLTVQDQNGALVSGLTISATVLRTGQSFAVPQGGSAGGRYVMFDDSFRDRVRASGDLVQVTGAGALHFTTGVRIDVPGGCHVRKVAGPDTVTAQ